MTRAEQIDTLLKKNPGMKPAEISETLGLAKSTVYKHLSRMRKGRRGTTAVAARRTIASHSVKVPMIERIGGEIDGEIAKTEGEIAANEQYLARLQGAREALA